MALIKCPECGREISEKAPNCPHCGFPMNDVQPNTQENTNNDTNPPKPSIEKKRMPTWVWISIVAAVLLVVGTIVFLCFNGKSSGSDAVQEEVAQISYPNITERGVEPFLLGSSMIDIPAKGAFYDTILLEKKFNAFEEDGEIHYNGLNEKELQEVKKEMGDMLIVESYGYAYVMKDIDTLMKIEYDRNGVIKTIEVLSSQIKMQNGVCVGLSSAEMFDTHKALFITPSSFNTELAENDLGEDAVFCLPNQPANISVKAFYDKIDFEYKEQYENKMMETIGFCDNDTLPLEAVKGSSVSSILIRK